MFNRTPDRPDRYQPPNAQPGSPFAWGTGMTGAGTNVAVAPREGYLTMTFVWMFLALLVSAGAAAFVGANQTALQFVIRNFFILVIAEFALVFAISLGINKLGALPSLALLFVYAVLNGMTIGVIVLANIAQAGNANGVLTAFLGASSIFGAAALYGAVTRRDLTRLGGILFMGLIGLIVVSIVHMFIGGSTLNLIIGCVGVLIFTGLTAFHVQKLNNGDLMGIQTREGASVVGALLLYLDFVNLFLMLLRIFGSNRD